MNLAARIHQLRNAVQTDDVKDEIARIERHARTLPPSEQEALGIKPELHAASTPRQSSTLHIGKQRN